MKFSLLSPEKKLAESECIQITIPTVDGQITVLPNHAPLYTLISAGEVLVKHADDSVESFAVGRGFAKITGADVAILVDFGINADDIQEEQIKAAKQRAEELLKTLTDETDLARAQADILRSLLQLKVKSRRTTNFR